MTDTTSSVAVSQSGNEEVSMPFYASAEFWVFAAFVIVVVLAYKKIKSGFISAMRLHAEKVKDKLAEAKNVRNEVQAELVNIQKKLKNMPNEIADMVEKSREEAVAYENAVKHDYMASLKIREEKFKERIRLDEEEFSHRIRTTLIEKTFTALGLLLEKNNADDNVLIHNTIVEFAEVLQQSEKD